MHSREAKDQGGWKGFVEGTDLERIRDGRRAIEPHACTRA